MKSTFTLLAFLLCSALAIGQITITGTDIPVPPEINNFDEITTTNPASPSVGANLQWDYSSHFGNDPFALIYPQETNPFFTNAGVDVYVQGFKNLNSNLGYILYNEVDFNNNDVLDAGVDIIYQAYSLAAYTGNTADSLVFPDQQYIFNQPRVFMHFPFTANSSWHSSSSRQTDFNLTITALGLNRVPGQQRYTIVRSDSIVGWGKMSVHTPNGPSIGYDVLMDRIEQYAVDSFFINGGPAPTVLLTSFGISQGQISGANYAYNFYRKGTYAYLMRFFYGADKTFTTLSQAFVNTDDLLTGIGDPQQLSYTTLVFPNPSNTNEINIKLFGKSISNATYVITDLSGKTVQNGAPTLQSNEMIQVKLNHQLINGNYFIKIFDESKHEVVSEQIEVQR
jgi:hypothetical protein